MKCPKCKKAMEQVESAFDVTFGHQGKKYKKNLYVCREDDIWVTVEEPDDN